MREFESVAEMQAHYAAVRKRCYEAKKVDPLPDIVEENDDEYQTPPLPEFDISKLSFSGSITILPSIPKPTAKEIIRKAADFHGLHAGNIIGTSRNRTIVRARHDAFAAMKLIYCDDRRWSLPLIGRRVGGRDHTTVIHALRKLGWTGSRWKNGLPDWTNREFGAWAEEIAERYA